MPKLPANLATEITGSRINQFLKETIAYVKTKVASFDRNTSDIEALKRHRQILSDALVFDSNYLLNHINRNFENLTIENQDLLTEYNDFLLNVNDELDTLDDRIRVMIVGSGVFNIVKGLNNRYGSGHVFY